MFSLIDQDGNNSIDLSEFSNRFFKPEEKPGDEIVPIIFNDIDGNGDGAITSDEFTTLLKGWRDGF